MIDGTVPCPLEQVTPGHEPAGTIARVGSDVPFWQPGQRVVIAPGRSCGSCRHCGDAPPACLAPQVMGQHWDGAWAAARRRALELGADHALDPRTVDVREEVQRLTDGEGLDLAAELSGVGSALAQAVSCLGRCGRAVMIGMSPEPIRLAENTLAFGYLNHAVLGHEGYTRRHLTQLMRLLASGRLDLSRSVSDVLPLEDIGLGVERLRTKEENPVRIVIKP